MFFLPDPHAPFAVERVPKRCFGILDFPYLKLGIRDLKSGQDWGLTVCPRGGMSKITIGITELHEILGRDYGIEEYYTLGILG